MIRGIGIDVVHISRMQRWEKAPGIFDRYFHSLEIEEAKKRGKAAMMSLAARFAAKEAFGKALGTGLKNIGLKEIWVKNDQSGKPCINVTGRALEAFENFGGKRIHLSLTHESDNAIAVVIIEGE